MIKKSLLVLGCILFLFVLTTPAYSCVGRILTLAVVDTPEQKLLGKIVASLITERTGTTVKVKIAPSIEACVKQLTQKEADIIINYIGYGLATFKSADKSINAQQAYGLVKQYYNEKFDIIWLKPFGYNGPVGSNEEKDKLGSLAIPVTTKDVLNRFPVLDRVINKLDNRIDTDTLQELIKKAELVDSSQIVKDFLKAESLI